MTTIFTDTSADNSANGVDYFFGNPFPEFTQAGVSSLHAAGMLGSGWSLPDGKDWSRNGRHPAIVGAPTVLAKGAICDLNNCYQLPFSPADVVAAGAALGAVATGSIAATTMTITAVASGLFHPGQLVSGGAIAANTYVVDQLTTTETDGSWGKAGTYSVNNSQTQTATTITGTGGKSLSLVAIGQMSSTSTTAGMLLGSYGGTGRATIGYESGKMAGIYGSSSSGWAATLANSGTRGAADLTLLTALRQFSGVITPTNGRVYRQAAGIAQATASSAVPTAPSLPNSISMIRVGGHYSTDFTNTHTIVGWAVYRRGLFAAELTTIQTALTAWLASRGVTL